MENYDWVLTKTKDNKYNAKKLGSKTNTLTNQSRNDFKTKLQYKMPKHNLEAFIRNREYDRNWRPS